MGILYILNVYNIAIFLAYKNVIKFKKYIKSRRKIMKKTRKKYLMILFLILSITLLPMGGVKAALQANPNTHVKRQMLQQIG